MRESRDTCASRPVGIDSLGLFGDSLGAHVVP